MKPALAVATLLTLVGNAPGAAGQENPSAGQPAFSVFAGQMAPDLLTTVTPAKVCRTGSNVCFEAPEKYVFDPEVVLVDPDEPLVLFMATASGGGSGTSTALALLEASSDRFENLTPRISLSEQGEYGLWREPGVSDAPILVTADYV